jgi:hypothetical protein
MSCAMKIYSHSFNGPKPVGLIVREIRKTGRFFEKPRHDQPAEASRPNSDRAGIGPTVIPDSVHADPEYVWGDEGPVND